MRLVSISGNLHASNITIATQAAFKKGVKMASKIGSPINEIEAASNEQAFAIKQIKRAVKEMSKESKESNEHWATGIYKANI